MSDSERRARLLRAAIHDQGPIEPREDDWTSWVELARTQRVIPLLHEVATQSARRITESQFAQATEMQLDVMGTMVRFEHDLLDIAATLDDGHVRFAVLKGAATAHLDYSDPALRQFADVDILISPEDLDRSLELLGHDGWRQAYPLPRHHERYTHAITLRKPGRVELDLHQRLAHRAVGLLIPADQVLSDSVQYTIAASSLPALASADRLIHAAVHAVTSRGRYRSLSSEADVLVLADKCHQPQVVLDRAQEWRVRSLVEHGLVAAYSSAKLDLPPGWRTALATPLETRDPLVDLAYLGRRRRPAAEEAAHLRLMGNWQDRTRYIRGYFATDRDYAIRSGRTGFFAQTKYLVSRVRPRNSS